MFVRQVVIRMYFQNIMMRWFFLWEENMLLVIIINLIVIFVLYFLQLLDVDWFFYLDYFFIVLFIMEVFIKICIYGWKGYWLSNWNCFDFMIVIGSMFILFIDFLLVFDILFLIVLCLFCLLCLVCFLCFIFNIGKVFNGFGCVFKVLVFVVLVLFFFNILLVLIMCQFYFNIVLEYFGNFLIFFYFIF